MHEICTRAALSRGPLRGVEAYATIATEMLEVLEKLGGVAKATLPGSTLPRPGPVLSAVSPFPARQGSVRDAAHFRERQTFPLLLAMVDNIDKCICSSLGNAHDDLVMPLPMRECRGICPHR